MFRLILSVIIALLYLILTLPVLGILALIGIRHPDVRSRAARVMIQWIFKVLDTAAGIHVTVTGLDRIPKDTAVLYIGNHHSIYDILITYPQLPSITGFVAKKTLGKVPVFSLWFKYIDCLSFDRDNLKEGMQMILDGIKMIKAGKSVFIFPEGTRNKNPENLPLLEFHEGSFRMATKSGCPIVPVAICNSVNILEQHMPWVRSTHVVIEYGEPIDPSAFSKADQKKIGTHVRDIMTEMIERNQKLV